MNYNEALTIFSDVMRGLEIESTEFDFAKAIDASADFFGVNLPADVVPELIKVYTADQSPSGSRDMTLPPGFLKYESIHLAKARDSEDNPIYIPASVIPYKAFMLKSGVSDDAEVAFFNDKMNFLPELASPAVGKNGSFMMVYRSEPHHYANNYSNISKGVLVQLDKVPGSNLLYTTETADQTWEELGLESSNLNGGKLIVPIGISVGVYDIDYAWDDDSGDFSGVHIKEGSIVPPSSTPISNCYVTEAPDHINGNNFISGDRSLPLNPSLHQVVLDYAIGRFLVGRRPDIAKLYLESTYSLFKTFGVNLSMDFDKEM